MDFDTEGGDILLFEFACQMALDEGSLSSTTITDKDELEGWGVLGHVDLSWGL
jgi:hypothetical protein